MNKNKSNSKLFSTDAITDRMELSKYCGGATSNNSDVTYDDSKMANGTYDIYVVSLMDIFPSKTKDDKPAPKPDPSKLTSVLVDIFQN